MHLGERGAATDLYALEVWESMLVGCWRCTEDFTAPFLGYSSNEHNRRHKVFGDPSFNLPDRVAYCTLTLQALQVRSESRHARWRMHMQHARIPFRSGDRQNSESNSSSCANSRNGIRLYVVYRHPNSSTISNIVSHVSTWTHQPEGRSDAKRTVSSFSSARPFVQLFTHKASCGTRPLSRT